MDTLRDYIKERDNILATIENLDMDQLKAYCEKWKIPMPDKEDVIIGGLHKARLNVTRLTGISNKEFIELKRKSREWLDKKGWSYDIR